MTKLVLTKEQYYKFAKALRDVHIACQNLYCEAVASFGKSNEVTETCYNYYSEFMDLYYCGGFTKALFERKQTGHVSDDVRYTDLVAVEEVGRGNFLDYGDIKRKIEEQEKLN